MSKSYRKPWVTDGQKSHGRRYSTKKSRRGFFKNLHNRIIRRIPVNVPIPNGCSHKRLGVDPWDICDWKWYSEVTYEYTPYKYMEYSYEECIEDRIKYYIKACRK